MSDGSEDDSSSESSDVLTALEVVHQEAYQAANGLPVSQLLAGAEPPPDTDAISDEEPAIAGDVSDDEEEEEEGEGPPKPRSRLPAPRPLGKGFSIWAVLKDAIGGDLTRITMPATINEPTSFLQVRAAGTLRPVAVATDAIAGIKDRVQCSFPTLLVLKA